MPMNLLKKTVCILMAAVMTLSLCSCALLENEIVEISHEEGAPYIERTEAFVEKLLQEDYVACAGMFGESLAAGKSRTQLQQEWEQMRLTYGNPVGVERFDPYRINGEGSVLVHITMTHGACTVQATYDKEDEMVALWFGVPDEQPGYTVAPPEGVKEQELTLGADGAYPLKAVLAMPENAAGDVPCVVLVHDAGAYDLNSALGAGTLFADLAHGLALQGVATLRYDKRTYTHGMSMDEKQVMSMTVNEEVIQDALLAVDAAAKAQGVDAKAVYVAGHGLGGMLAPRIAVQSKGAVAGIVSMGGTARDYLEMAYDQNLAMTNDAEHKNAIKKEYKKVGKLENMKDSDTVFGLPVLYLKDLYANPVSVQLEQLDIPVLVLHGKNDFQYSLDNYKSWQTALRDYKGETECVLFDDLNHLFVNNKGFKRRGTTAEYLNEAKTAQEVIDKIADWIK